MRKLRLLSLLLFISAFIAISCTKEGPEGPVGATGLQGPPGSTGPAGPAGPAGPSGSSVIYSNWFAPAAADWIDTTIGIPGPVKRAWRPSATLTLPMLQTCVVLAYMAFDPVATARTYQLPTQFFVTGLTTPFTMGYVVQPGRVIYYYGTVNGSPNTVAFNPNYQFRYVIIPGSVAAGAGGRITSGPAAGYTEAELKGMSYEEVARKFRIPVTGSNIE
jgi:hypothetical protein